MCDYRDIQKSIRISEDVYNFINKYNGDNFNDRLNNIFKLFMLGCEDKKAEIELLNKRYDDLKSKYDELVSAITIITDLEDYSQAFIKSVREMINYCDTIRGRDDVLIF